MNTYEKIKSYFDYRGQTIPTQEDAMHFVLQEVGELSDSLVRNKKTDYVRNNERSPSIAFEIGDLYQQLTILAEVAGISDYDPNLKEFRYKSSFFDVAHGAYTVVNNLDMGLDARYDLKHVFERLHTFSLDETLTTPYANMVAKWESKGYKL